MLASLQQVNYNLTSPQKTPSIVFRKTSAGVIGPQEAHPVNAREFGSAHPEPEAEIKTGGLFGSGSVSSSTTAEAETQRYTPGPPSSTVPSIPPSTETSMIEGNSFQTIKFLC